MQIVEMIKLIKTRNINNVIKYDLTECLVC